VGVFGLFAWMPSRCAGHRRLSEARGVRFRVLPARLRRAALTHGRAASGKSSLLCPSQPFSSIRGADEDGSSACVSGCS